MIHSKFRLIAPPFAPMHGDGRLNLAPIPDYAMRLVADGVAGVFVNGTSGEGQSLTVEERFAVAEAWAGASERPQFEFIIHVGHNAQGDAARLAAHAQSIGADAIAMHTPTWFRSQKLGDMIEFAAAVAAAAPKLRYYLYDIPVVSGVNLSSAEFLRHAKKSIPTLAGLKYTNPDCVTAQECIQLGGGEFELLWGMDETLLIGAALGAAGAVGTTYNFMGPYFQRMLQAAEKGDWQSARAQQASAISMIRACQKYTPLAALKFAMSLAGIDCGPVRPPVGNLSDEAKSHVRAVFAEGQYIAGAR